MDSDEYVNKLTLDTSNFMGALRAAGEGFQAVKLETTAFAQALADLNAEESRAAATGRSFADALARVKVEEIDLVPITEDVSSAMRTQAAATNEATAAMDQLKGTSSSSGRGILGVSYAVQDFTSVMQGGGGFGRAIASIQNNIPQVLEALGMGAGLAGTISLVSVGLGVAIPLLMSFAGEASNAAEAAKKLAAETNKLDMMRTGKEDETAKNVAAFMKDLPARTVKQGISAELTARARAQGLEDIPRQMQEFGVITETAEAFAARMAPKIQEDTERLYTSLDTDAESRKFVAGLAAIRPQNFPRGFAADIASFDSDTGEADLAAAEAFGARAHGGVENRRMNRAATEERRRRVEGRQKKEDESIRQAADEEERGAKEAQDRADRIAATYVEDDKLNDRVMTADRRATDAAARKADAAAKKAARAADPSVMAGRERERLEDRARTMAEGMEGPMGWQPSRTQFEAMIHQAVGNMPMGGGQAELARAIQQSAWAGYRKSQEDMARQVRRGEVWSEQR